MLKIEVHSVPAFRVEERNYEKASILLLVISEFQNYLNMRVIKIIMIEIVMVIS